MVTSVPYQLESSEGRAEDLGRRPRAGDVRRGTARRGSARPANGKPPGDTQPRDTPVSPESRWRDPAGRHPAPLELTVERVAPGGDCVAHAPDGRVVFVRGRFRESASASGSTDENKCLLRAETIEVLEASSDRVSPPCPLAVPGPLRWLRLAACRPLPAAARAEGSGATRAADPARRDRSRPGDGRGGALARPTGWAGVPACRSRSGATARAACCAIAPMPSNGSGTARSPTRSSTRPERGAPTGPRPIASPISPGCGWLSRHRRRPVKSWSTTTARWSHQAARPRIPGQRRRLLAGPSGRSAIAGRRRTRRAGDPSRVSGRWICTPGAGLFSYALGKRGVPSPRSRRWTRRLPMRRRTAPGSMSWSGPPTSAPRSAQISRIAERCRSGRARPAAHRRQPRDHAADCRRRPARDRLRLL